MPIQWVTPLHLDVRLVGLGWMVHHATLRTYVSVVSDSLPSAVSFCPKGLLLDPERTYAPQSLPYLQVRLCDS